MENSGGSLNKGILNLILDALFMHKAPESKIESLLNCAIPRYSQKTLTTICRRFYFVHVYYVNSTIFDLNNKSHIVPCYTIHDYYKTKCQCVFSYSNGSSSISALHMESIVDKTGYKLDSDDHFYMCRYAKDWFLINKNKETRNLFAAYLKNQG